MVTAVPVGIAWLSLLLKSRRWPVLEILAVLASLADGVITRGYSCPTCLADLILACRGPFRAISRAGTSHTASNRTNTRKSRSVRRSDGPARTRTRTVYGRGLRALSTEVAWSMGGNPLHELLKRCPIFVAFWL
jgi:hypothetical protein